MSSNEIRGAVPNLMWLDAREFAIYTAGYASGWTAGTQAGWERADDHAAALHHAAYLIVQKAARTTPLHHAAPRAPARDLFPPETPWAAKEP